MDILRDFCGLAIGRQMFSFVYSHCNNITITRKRERELAEKDIRYVSARELTILILLY